MTRLDPLPGTFGSVLDPFLQDALEGFLSRIEHLEQLRDPNAEAVRQLAVELSEYSRDIRLHLGPVLEASDDAITFVAKLFEGVGTVLRDRQPNDSLVENCASAIDQRRRFILAGKNGFERSSSKVGLS